MRTKKAPVVRSKGDKITPTQVLMVRQMVDESSVPHYVLMIYRDANTPGEDFTDLGHIKPAPVMFQIVDRKDKVIERDMADTFGKALDYATVFGKQRGLVLTNLKR